MARRTSKRTCRLCGKEFIGAVNALYCPDCWTQKCPVCGKDVHMSHVQMTYFAKRGWITCSRSCGQKWRDLKHEVR